MENDQRIENLLQDFDSVNPDLGKIVRSLRKIVLSIVPISKEKIMYGGIIFSIPNRMFCGLFLRKNYVSVEFDLGYRLKDINNHLEGSGKFRRHLKIFNEMGIKIKETEQFVMKSFELETL